MSGLVYCRWCDTSSVPRSMDEHELACPSNPANVGRPPAPPAPPRSPGHVANDHFLHQFDRYEAGDARLRAMALHCALLFNQLQDERALRLASYRDIVQKLSDANPLTELALSLEAAACDMEDDR